MKPGTAYVPGKFMYDKGLILIWMAPCLNLLLMCKT